MLISFQIAQFTNDTANSSLTIALLDFFDQFPQLFDAYLFDRNHSSPGDKYAVHLLIDMRDDYEIPRIDRSVRRLHPRCEPDPFRYIIDSEAASTRVCNELNQAGAILFR
jgi:hypothetical protein